MVLGAGPVRALIIPDEQSWTMLGADPPAQGFQPTCNPEAAAAVLTAEEVPEGLAAGVSACRELLPDGVRVEYRELAFPGGTSVRMLLEEHEHAHDHGEHDHGAHEHGGHHDMMAIVGEPSADGLVMERIRLTHGPLGTTFAGGLAVDATLDGDVVAESVVRALLRAEPGGAEPGFPDALSPVAWTVALGDPADTGWLDVAAVELERAISHLAWLRSLGRLLDSNPLIDACTQALASLQVSREILPPAGTAHDVWLRAALGAPDLAASREALEAIVALVGRSRALRRRLRGRAVVTGAVAHDRGLLGPVGRASGRRIDARSTDARYAALAFDPVVRSEGDALARAVLRAEEALAAVRLAAGALKADSPIAAADRVVEGPRGPLHAHTAAGRWTLVAPGADAARAAAADAMIGLEWSAALIALASFDLSPWRVGS